MRFEDFINNEQRYKKINHGAQKIRNEYVTRPASTIHYLHALFDFFLNDIKEVAEVIYLEILHKKDRGGIKFKPIELKECIENATRSQLSAYNRIISGYNAGGMFRECDNFEKEKSSFHEQAEDLCNKQSELFETKYIKLLAENRHKSRTYYAAIVGAITGVISLIGLAGVFEKKHTVSTLPNPPQSVTFKYKLLPTPEN